MNLTLSIWCAFDSFRKTGFCDLDRLQFLCPFPFFSAPSYITISSLFMVLILPHYMSPLGPVPFAKLVVTKMVSVALHGYRFGMASSTAFFLLLRAHSIRFSLFYYALHPKMPNLAFPSFLSVLTVYFQLAFWNTSNVSCSVCDGMLVLESKPFILLHTRTHTTMTMIIAIKPHHHTNIWRSSHYSHKQITF